MKKYITFCLVLLALGFDNDLLAAPDSTITIHGQFLGDSKKYGKIVSLRYFDNYYSLISPYTKYEVPIINGKFDISIKNNKPYAYIVMMYGVDENNHVVRTKSTEILRSNLYLIQSGSEVSLKISDDDVLFSGKGAELVKCQYELYHDVGQQGGAPIKNNDWYGSFKQMKIQSDSLYAKQLSILAEYKPVIGDFAYYILKSDFEADKNLTFVNSGAVPDFTHAGDPKHKQENEGRIRFYTEHFMFMQPDTTHLEAKLISRSYSEFLLRKLVHDMDLAMLATSKTTQLNFEQIYNKVSQDYTGALRDKLLAVCFLDYFQKRQAAAWYLDNALAKVKTRDFHDFIQWFKDTYGIGTSAFNFSLQDTSGQVYTQEMLKGKIVILDFWFTGCGGCQQLNEKMKPVYDYYKDNPGVTFVTISIDKQLDMFKRSVKEGKYTHPGSLNLYTGRKYTDDPVIGYYKVISYPTMIIIGKDGKIITGSPPLPYGDGGAQFIRLINNSLN